MAGNRIIIVALAALVLSGIPLGCHFLGESSINPQFTVATAVRRELRLVVSTNGIIEPIDRADVFAPIDAFVTSLQCHGGAEVRQGQLLMRLESKQLMTALAEARASLLEARRQAESVVAGPSKEELVAVETAIAESEVLLKQRREDLRAEEDLLKKDATTRAAVESLRKEVSLLELRVDALRRKKESLLNRYSPDEKQWEQDRISELTRQVDLLQQQVQMGTILSPRNGVLYAIAVRVRSYVNRGQLLAQVYDPGKVRLRAYVDEPDLGRIQKDQGVLVEWDGLPGRQWTGVVERPAEEVVALGNRSVGQVICAIQGEPKELIPNINVRVQIVTARKPNALVVPRAAVFSFNGQPTVMVLEGNHTALKPVTLGLVTPQEAEILQGIDEGNAVVTNPGIAPSR
jgi:HlyD family secretion protein